MISETNLPSVHSTYSNQCTTSVSKDDVTQNKKRVSRVHNVKPNKYIATVSTGDAKTRLSFVHTVKQNPDSISVKRQW